MALFPHSESTDVLVERRGELLRGSVPHPLKELRRFVSFAEESVFRAAAIAAYLQEMDISLHTMEAIVAPAGLLKPLPGGVYAVSEKMLSDLRGNLFEPHHLNMGAFMAEELASCGDACVAYVAEPVCQNEMLPEASLCGFPEIKRRSVFHALPQKGAAWEYAYAAGKPLGALNLVAAYLGAEISVGAHEGERVIDVNNPWDGEGPFSPHTAGGLPAGELVNACFDGKQDFNYWMEKLLRSGGLFSHLGTADIDAIEGRILEGDREARDAVAAMSYQISREICCRAAALCGQVDAILLVGPWAGVEYCIEKIRERVEWIAPVHVFPEMDELTALVVAGQRVLLDPEQLKIYE